MKHCRGACCQGGAEAGEEESRPVEGAPAHDSTDEPCAKYEHF